MARAFLIVTENGFFLYVTIRDFCKKPKDGSFAQKKRKRYGAVNDKK